MSTSNMSIAQKRNLKISSEKSTIKLFINTCIYIHHYFVNICLFTKKKKLSSLICTALTCDNLIVVQWKNIECYFSMWNLIYSIT